MPNLEDYYNVPIILAIVLICFVIMLGQFGLKETDNPETQFLQKASELTSNAKVSRSVFETKTTKTGLSGMIEEIPIFGGVVKSLKFLGSIISTLRIGVDLFIGFIQDIMRSELLGIDGRIMTLVGALLFGGFGFAVFKSISKSS